MSWSEGHRPVLLEEAIAHLRPLPGQRICDGTLGAGGHTKRLLECLAPKGRVFAVDKDPAAHALAAKKLGVSWQRVDAVHASFAKLPELCAERGIAEFHGILLDLGVSSMQLHSAERGFSFASAGPIDMRMNPEEGATALELIRHKNEMELATLIRCYGEERYHRRIARAIKQALAAELLTDTAALARVIKDALPAPAQRRMRIHPATKTLQALRIAVNHELADLARFLDTFPPLLARGARCVVISFHSLEDRLVKRRFRELAWSSSLPEKYAREAGERPFPVCKLVTRKAVVATAEELRRNPRARSARLRVCEKVGDDRE